MKGITTKLASPTRLGLQSLRNIWQRLSVALMLAMLTAATGWAQTTESVTYIDADGTEKTVTATVLTGSETVTKWNTIDLAAGWYVVKSNISYTNQIAGTGLVGTINIILADGAEMTVNPGDQIALQLSSIFPLAIYGQSAGTGRLSVTSDFIAISANGGITINGGIVSATSTGYGRPAINANNRAVTINGGQLTATPGENSSGIFTEGTITLGLRSASDFITANGYYGTVNIKDGQALKAPSGNIYYGTLTDAQKSAIANVTLQPATQAEFIAAALPQTAADTYTISDATGWSVFCDALQDNDTYNRFSGKTVKLGNNIGTAQAPITRMAGSDDHDFCGTFDGQGNTLYVNFNSDVITDGKPYVAPFRYVSNGTVNNVQTPAAIRNLHVTGNITTSKQYTAGLIGGCWGNVSIENCAVSTAINSTIDGDGSHGGIVGIHSSGTLTITGCVFDGNLLGEDTESVGGFIGWRNKGANIYNSLFIPTEVTVKKANSATFARNDVDTHNCYYTYYLCDGEHYVPYYATDGITRRNGHAPHTVTAADDVTIEPIALTGTATQYDVSGITAYSGGGLQLGETLYYGSGDQLSLTLSNSATGAPLGYQYGFTASAGTLSGTTLTMPDQDVTISVSTAHLASTGQPVAVPYVDADGTLHDGDNAAQAVALDGSEHSLAAGTYFVGLENVNFGQTVNLEGNVNLILADGKTMNVGKDDARIDDFGIFVWGALTIYGQANGTGALSVYVSGDGKDAINANALTINGGIITADANGEYAAGLNTSDNGTVIINGGTVNASDTDPSDSGESYGIYGKNIAINGGNVNATATGNDPYGIVAQGSTTLGWNKPTDRIFASSYYGTVQVATTDGKKLYNGSKFLSGNVSDLADINGKTLRPAANATYTTADGTTATADAILLDASDNSLPAGNYLATGTLNYTDGITLTGDVTLILADNCHMNVGTSGGRINGSGISGGYDLNIFGQANGTGALSVYTTGTEPGGFYDAISVKAITINGGNITADTNGTDAAALNVFTDLTINRGTVSATTTGDATDGIQSNGAVTINGGTVTADASRHGIYANGNFNYNGGIVTATAPNGNAIKAFGNYTFSWRTPADRITIGATGLFTADDKTATFTRLFTDADGNYYGGTLTGTEALATLAGKTISGTAELVLANAADNSARIAAAIGMSGLDVMLAGRTLYKDGAWNTLCLPFDVTLNGSPLEGAIAKTLVGAEMSGEDLSLTFGEAVTTLQAGTPYIIKWDGDGTDNIVEPVFTNVTIDNSAAAIARKTVSLLDGQVKFVGYYDALTLDPVNGSDDFAANVVPSIYYMTADNTLKHTGVARTLHTCRAYFQFAETAQQAREIRLDFGEDETTGIVSMLDEEGGTRNEEGDMKNGAWYTVDGVKLNGKPTRKGLYIFNGKVVVIK